MTGADASLGANDRPVAVPDDVDDPRHIKAVGRVQLPAWVGAGHRSDVYDLANPKHRRHVYEQILRDGTDDDVRRYIDVDVLLEEWDVLALSVPVRRAWAVWFRRHRGIELAC